MEDKKTIGIYVAVVAFTACLLVLAPGAVADDEIEMQGTEDSIGVATDELVLGPDDDDDEDDDYQGRPCEPNC